VESRSPQLYDIHEEDQDGYDAEREFKEFSDQGPGADEFEGMIIGGSGSTQASLWSNPIIIIGDTSRNSESENSEFKF
jgi:hypothetical protein